MSNAACATTMQASLQARRPPTLQRSWLERRQVRISEALRALLCFRDSRQHLQETAPPT